MAMSSTQKLSRKFKQVHLDLATSIEELKYQADESCDKNSGQVTINQEALETLLKCLTEQVNSIGHLGTDMEKLCVSLTESLTTSNNKSTTLRKKMKLMQKEQTMSVTRQRSQRQREMQKTKAIFERSLSEIRNTYERSQRTMNNDYEQMEQMAQRMKEYRVEIGDKRRQNFNIIQQRSHETISRMPSGRESLMKDTFEDTAEEEELFRGSDLLQTYKQVNVFGGEPMPI